MAEIRHSMLSCLEKNGLFSISFAGRVVPEERRNQHKPTAKVHYVKNGSGVRKSILFNPVHIIFLL